jgi:hypothetical protein
MIINTNGVLLRQNDDLKFATNSNECSEDARELCNINMINSNRDILNNFRQVLLEIRSTIQFTYKQSDTNRSSRKNLACGKVS